MIELTTLGRISIRANGTERSELPAHKQKFALLVYLAVEGPVSRDRLLSVFWPEREEEKARHSLSQALYALKRELQEDCVRVEGDTISCSCDGLTVDITQLEAAAKAENWQAIVDLYRGPFLDQFYLPGSPDFENWCVSTRARLSRLMQRAFASVVAQCEATGDRPAALAVAGRWAELEPLRDEARHTLIGLLGASGERAAALAEYEAYRKQLAQELEVEPLEETVSLVERIRAGEQPEFRSLSGASPAESVPPQVHEPDRPYYEAAASEEGGLGAAPDAGSGTEELDWRKVLSEVRRRRIFQVGLVYTGVSWLAIQVGDTLVDRDMLPDPVFPALLFLLAVGLPIALILAWAQEQPGAAGLEGLLGIRRWPRWVHSVRPGHVLGFLATLVLGLLVGRYLLERSLVTAASVDAATGLDRTHIAVLYFDDHSENQQYGHLTASFTTALINQLTQIEALTVSSANAVKPYRDADVGADSIARALNVGTLVEGSILVSGSRVRVTVGLVDGVSGAQVQSRELERQLGNIFALMDDVTQEVSRFLRRRLGSEIRLREWRAGTESVDAWQAVQRAEQLRAGIEPWVMMGDTTAAATALERADSLLSQAEAWDPRWVEPIVQRGWVAAVRARLFAVTSRTYDQELTRLGIAHAERAIELDPIHPAALELRGTLRRYLWETADSAEAAELREGALEDLRAAVAADPSRARAWSDLSRILRVIGRFPEAKVAAERAYEADAFLASARTVVFNLCHTSLELEEFDDATRWCDEGRRRFPDRASFIALKLLFLAGSDGPEPDADEAWQLQQLFVDKSPPQKRPQRRVDGLMRVAAVLARSGLADSAEAVVLQARAADAQNDPLTDYYEANVRLQLEQRDQALSLLRGYLEARPDRKTYIAEDWWWRPLRDDPRFKALVGTAD